MIINTYRNELGNLIKEFRCNFYRPREEITVSWNLLKGESTTYISIDGIKNIDNKNTVENQYLLLLATLCFEFKKEIERNHSSLLEVGRKEYLVEVINEIKYYIDVSEAQIEHSKMLENSGEGWEDVSPIKGKDVIIMGNLKLHYEELKNKYAKYLITEPSNDSQEIIIETEAFNYQIFKTLKGFHFFKALIKEFPNVNDDHAFIFRKLFEDGYTYRISQSTFKDFCNADPYNLSIDKIKTLSVLSNEKRNALYASILKGIK